MNSGLLGANTINMNGGEIKGIDILDMRNDDLAIGDTLLIKANDINRVSDGNSLYVRGDGGLDNVSSVQFRARDFVENVDVDGVTYAHYSRNGEGFYLEQGLLLNGSIV